MFSSTSVSAYTRAVRITSIPFCYTLTLLAWCLGAGRVRLRKPRRKPQAPFPRPVGPHGTPLSPAALSRTSKRVNFSPNHSNPMFTCVVHELNSPKLQVRLTGPPDKSPNLVHESTTPPSDGKQSSTNNATPVAKAFPSTWLAEVSRQHCTHI